MTKRGAAILLATLTLGAACSDEPTTAPATSTTAVPATTTTTAPPLTAAAPCGSATIAAPVTYDHVIWIWMENHQRAQVIDSPDAPFETALAHACASAQTYNAVGAPSLPNYIAATAGDTFGVTDDASPAAHPIDADNLFRQVRTRGGRAVSYQEAMPGTCALEPSGTYAVKHNPAAYFTGADDREACVADDVALGTPASGPLADALADHTVPAFSFVTPDLCNDTHDCPVAVGDRWLSTWVAALVATPEYQHGTTMIFLVWDEPTPMPFIAVAPTIPTGMVIAEAIDHYSLLRTTEELLGIDTFLGHAATATSFAADLAR